MVALSENEQQEVRRMAKAQGIDLPAGIITQADAKDSACSIPLSSLLPETPPHYTPEETQAYLRGMMDGQMTGEDSLEIVSPYDVDDESNLYDAWQAGCDAAAGMI